LPRALHAAETAFFADSPSHSVRISVSGLAMHPSQMSSFITEFRLVPIPEPGPLVLVAGGVTALAAWRRRSRSPTQPTRRASSA